MSDPVPADPIALTTEPAPEPDTIDEPVYVKVTPVMPATLPADPDLPPNVRTVINLTRRSIT